MLLNREKRCFYLFFAIKACDKIAQSYFYGLKGRRIVLLAKFFRGKPGVLFEKTA